MFRPPLLLALLTALPCLGQPANSLANSGFADGLGGWTPFAGANGFTAAEGLLRYDCNPTEDNAHLDQTPTVEAGKIYHASVEIRAEGQGLAPSLRIAGMDWNTIADAGAPADGQWHTAATLFVPPESGPVRFQLFGAGRGRKGADASGTTWFRNPVLRPGNEEELAAFHSSEITVDPTRPGPAVSPLFFGVNSLFWITDDAARADGKIAAHLKDMGCTLVRFPGGEVADNYHWRTNTLDNTKNFPFQDGPGTMDFDEFMAWIRPIGAQPICVVNLESCYLRGDVEAGVREAADWVRYANVTKGYGVTYWEIGNESDLAGTRRPFAAEEYARAVVRFSQAMKAVDPSIRIGALGPLSPTHAGALDRLPPEQRQEFLSLPPGERRSRLKSLPLAEHGAAWWPTVCRSAGGHFDFAVVHRYDSTRRALPDVAVPPLGLATQVQGLDNYLRERFGREIPLALTEWNVWRNATELGKLGHALTIAEQVGNYLEGGIDLANYWPMRYPRGKASNEFFRGLLDYESKEPRAAFHVLKLFRGHANGHVIPVRADNPNLYAFATRDANGAALFLVNRLGLGAGIEARVLFPGTGAATAEILVGAEDDLGVRLGTIPVERRAGAWHCRLPPHSLTVLRFAAQPSSAPRNGANQAGQ